MSPNHVDLENALAELRCEAPPGDAQKRMVGALTHPPLRRIPSRLVAAAAVAALFTFVLWPRQGTGVAWAQSQSRTAGESRSHEVWYYGGGKIGGERWTDGRRMADWALQRDGSIWIETRNDGKHEFWYFNRAAYKTTPNSIDAATIRTIRRPRDRYVGRSLVTELVTNKNVKVLGQETVHTEDGDRTIYRVKMPAESPFTSTIYAEPDTGRIRRIVQHDGGESLIDYPDAISDDVFSASSRKASQAKLYDVDVLQGIAQARMRAGMGTDKGITLRLAVMDSYGAVWVYWTGSLPDGKMSHPIRLTGIPVSAPFGVRGLTSSYEPYKNIRPPMIKGVRLGGMGVTPKVKLGETLPEVQIPGSHGMARFRNVPLLRICTVGDLDLYY